MEFCLLSLYFIGLQFFIFREAEIAHNGCIICLLVCCKDRCPFSHLHSFPHSFHQFQVLNILETFKNLIDFNGTRDCFPHGRQIAWRGKELSQLISKNSRWKGHYSWIVFSGRILDSFLQESSWLTLIFSLGDGATPRQRLLSFPLRCVMIRSRSFETELRD